MDVSAFLSEASFWIPDHAADPFVQSTFHPALFWLVEAAEPMSVAQLGFQRAEVYLAVCEAVKRLGLATSCVAVDPMISSSSGEPRPDAAIQRAGEIHARAFETFSRIARVPVEEMMDYFPNRSIDLIHPIDSNCVGRFWSDLDSWRSKLSERAILLLSRTHEGETRRLFQKLARHYPSFEFTHGDGLGVIALGEAPPERVRALLDADAVPRLRNQIRLAYSRLGRSLEDGKSAGPVPVEERNSPPGRSSGERGLSLENLVLREENEALREENERIAAKIGQLDQALQALGQENAALRQENPGLRHGLEHYQRLHALANEQLDALRGSAALTLLEKGRRFRGRYFPQTRLHGRCLELAVRFARVSIQTGPRAAVGKAARRALRRVGFSRRPDVSPPVPEPAAVHQAIEPPTRQRRAFEDLPWRYTGERSREGARARPTLKILLVSHSACRTGAPLCLLRLAEELSRDPDVECWAVLRIGGEIRPRFERVAPALELYELESVLGFPWDDSPGEIAARFREFSSNGVAICNTMVVSDFHEALAAENIPILSWVHELPTFIDLLGGEEAMDRIRSASRRTIVPANVVREALLDRFAFDPSRVQTISYGLEPKTRGLSREAMRKRVREELELPADALIVLGCGTIDHRKGTDLFAQLGRTFLLKTAPTDLAARTYFVWIGLTADEDLRKWLLHDVENAGLSDRVRFLSERQDMSPYFLAADLFALTSREDPCPFANLEAMESALPVLAFENSGGAPEVLGGNGVIAPYLDVTAMAEAARDLLQDDSKRLAMGERGRAAVRSRFTWSRFMTEFRKILEAEYGLRPATRPTVSVIVPNYRHAPYLEARLRSIFEQTVPPHEIIFLDDASTDESVEIARRLALESPVPMRVIVNERNSGGTFRQWLKGFELAEGDLVWIAESDDRAHPEFLERLLPEFHDQDVVLAYCQSALIDSEDRLLAPDFLGHTDDISPARWRSRYSATCDEEAEIALSRKNTIPNASAALFRRCGELDFADELAGLRFAGDWLFYALRIRGGKIAFQPEALNHYRRHEMSVSHQAFKDDTHAEETLYVKIRVIETYSASAKAICLGLAQTFLEHAMLARMFNLKRPPLTSCPRAAIAKLLDRARAAFERQTEARGELRILFILDAPRRDLAFVSSLHLINALARDHRVFLCVASPSAESETLAAELDARVTPIEGTLGAAPWSSDGFEGGFRVDVLKELIRFHQIDVIHSRFEEADRLAATINVDLNLPWFVHVDDARAPFEGSADPTLHEALATVSGVFHEGADARGLAASRPGLAGKSWIRLYDGLNPEALAVPETPIRKRDGEFLVYLVTDDERRDPDSQSAMAAVQLVNRLSSAERGGRRVRLVLPDGSVAASLDSEGLDEFAVMAQCDTAIAPNAGDSCRVSPRIAALLARRIPVIAPNAGAIRDMLSPAPRQAGLEVPSDGRPTLAADRAATAILRYLREPNLHGAHRDGAGELFDARFRVDHAAAICAAAYHHTRDFLVFAPEPRVSSSPDVRPTPGIVSRESA